jgi:hypothetical protein
LREMVEEIDALIIPKIVCGINCLLYSRAAAGSLLTSAENGRLRESVVRFGEWPMQRRVIADCYAVSWAKRMELGRPFSPAVDPYYRLWSCADC